MNKEKGFDSILGFRVNDPSVCIKGNGHFACSCASCVKEMQIWGAKINKILNLPKEDADIFWDKIREVRKEFGWEEGLAMLYCMEGFGI